MHPADEIIKTLNLEKHPKEGGFFRRTYTSKEVVELSDNRSRPLASSIYYLLCGDAPYAFLHKNRSDIMHYFHAGSACEYLLFSDEGGLQRARLGCDLSAGERPQLLVPGDVWKACFIPAGETYCLLSEAVVPGFDYADNVLANADDLQNASTEVRAQLRAFLAP